MDDSGSAPPVLRSPRGSLHAFSNNAEEQYLPWKIAFRVQFQSEKLGLRFHPAHFPDTGNGIYTIRVLELNKNPTGTGPAQTYNASLKPGHEHLQLRAGLYLTHIDETHLLDVACEQVISSLQTAKRPTTLRFVDVEAGVVTPHELRDSLKIDPEPVPMLIDEGHTAAVSPTRRSSNGNNNNTTMTAAAAVAVPPQSPMRTGGAVSSPSSSPETVYKIILLGTTGVGKSSVLAVGTRGDDAYVERRATTLEAEFGSFEIADPDMSTRRKIKARIWDTAGQERYRAITRSHYRRADGALLVYDVAERESFEKLGEWLKTLQETAGDSLKSIMVVENKIDTLPVSQSSQSSQSHTTTTSKRDTQRTSEFVQPHDVQAFCEDHGLLFVRTTAKKNAQAFQWDGQRVSDAFSSLLLHIHATNLARGMSSASPDSHTTNAGSAGAGTIALTAAAAQSGGGDGSKSLSDCGSCGRSQ